MKELWIQATEIYNLPFTIGLIFFCGYWLISSLGIFDIDTDVDIDLEADANIGEVGGIFSSIMNFVNAADVPVMLILTLLNVFMWAISMISNELLNLQHSIGIASGLLILNFIVSVVLVRLISKPLAPLFDAIKNDIEAAEPLIGQVGKVKSRVLDHHYGQVEVARHNTAPALVNCKLRESEKPLVRGDQVLIISHNKDDKKYLVRSLDVVDDSVVDTHDIADQSSSEETNETQILTIEKE